MTLTIAGLRAWSPPGLEGAATCLLATRTATGELADDLCVTVRMLDRGWEGPASQPAAAAIRRHAATASDLMETLSFARRITLALADAIGQAQELLAQADDIAQANGIRVRDPLTLAHGEELTAEALAPVATRQIRDLVTRALALAREADADAARAFRAAMNAGALDISHEQDLYDAVLAPALPHDRSPEAVAAWWAALPAAAQAALLRLHPEVLGNLDGIPFQARMAANRTNIADALRRLGEEDRQLTDQLDRARAQLDDLLVPFESENAYMVISLRDQIAELEQQLADNDALRQFCSGLLDPVTGYDAQGRPITLPNHQVLLFDLAGGRFAEVVGTIGPHTDNIAVMVGGTGTNLLGMGGEYARAESFVSNAEDIQPPGSLAIITYLGGPMPQQVAFDAFDSSYALDRAAGLASFVNHLDNPTGAPVTVVGHSYGGSVVGAAEVAGMHADRILHVESAGAGPHVTSTEQYAFPGTDRYSMTAPGDPITMAQGSGVGPIGHGADPDLLDGVVRLETGLVDAGDPSSGVLEGMSAHSGVFAVGTTAYDNILAVMTGGEVSLYVAPDEFFGGADANGVVQYPYPMQDPSYHPPTMDVR